MKSSWCPRCGKDLTGPDASNECWRCAEHGEVLPLDLFDGDDPIWREALSTRTEVPLWVPDPMPPGWAFAGVGLVADADGRVRATATACRGPAPLGGDGEWLIVAEEPGVGLGAGYARNDTEPTRLATSSPGAKVHTAGRPSPLWSLPDVPDDRSVYVGEAEGVWLWLISFPSDAGYALMDDIALADARDHSSAALAELQASGIDVFGPSARLRPA